MSAIETFQPGLDHVSELFDLRREVFAGELAEAGVLDDHIQRYLTQWHKDDYAYGVQRILADPHRSFIGLQDERGVCGYMITNEQCPKAPDYQYVEAIGLHARVRGQGHGTKLITDFIQGGKPTRLHVLKHNLPAKRLYERLGFAVIRNAKPWDICGQKVPIELMKREGELHEI